MISFTSLGVSKNIIKVLKKIKYFEPTSIQAKTISLILEKKDMIGQAETGSGKTAACAIPAIQLVDVSLVQVQVLVLAPTRELAVQYLEEMSSIALPLGIKTFVAYGGFDKSIQKAKLKDGVQILIATPGRLIDLIYSNYICLDFIKLLIIDEADEMLKTGFLDDVIFIKKCLVQKHQTLLFSATMPPEIKKIAKQYMKGALHIKLNHEQITPQGLNHYFIKVDYKKKNNLIHHFLKNEDVSQCIIFCNTRRKVSSVYKDLERKIKKLDFLHGGLAQELRLRIIDNFRNKKNKFIITTDVMSRGLDFSNISHIIHYDIPDNPEIYIHRSGRTARQGLKGCSIALLTNRDRKSYNQIKKIADISPESFNPETYKKFSYRSKRTKKSKNKK